MNFSHVVTEMAKQAAKIEDSAVSAYINAQAADLIARGEKLSDYELIRVESDNWSPLERTDDGYVVKYRYQLRKIDTTEVTP